jgi:hypothetical protein
MNTGFFYRDLAPQKREDSTPPEEILANTRVVDISDDFLWLERSRLLTAEAYAALADPNYGLKTEDIVPIISADYYERNGRATTLAALTRYPELGAQVIAGQARLVLGGNDSSGTPALDAMSFVEPIDGWPHQQLGLRLDQIAEVGRFMIVPNCRSRTMRNARLNVHLTRLLYEACVHVARKNHIKMVYAIMPAYMVRVVMQAGISVKPIESRLKTEDPVACQVFDRFSLYWKHASPRLYECVHAPAPTQADAETETAQFVLNPS